MHAQELLLVVQKGSVGLTDDELEELFEPVATRYDHATRSWTVVVNQMMFYAFAQPLPEDELLLICPAAALYEPNLFTLNAAVFTADGLLRCRFLVGDGIASVQTTRSGHIWTSYLDEGIFGNRGWGSSRLVRRRDGLRVAPVGAEGVREWDGAGRALYRYPVEARGAMMADCYALNVVDDTTAILYYYPDFPLVCVQDHQIAQVWYPNTQMASAIAIWRQWVLLITEPKNAGIQWWLYELGDGATIQLVGAYAPQTPAGQPLQGWVSTRADRCSVLDGAGNLYFVTVEELLTRSH